MQTSSRFNQAVRKLYDAFHQNYLNPDACTQCAVGNILDNKSFWRHFTDDHGAIKLNYVGLVHQNLGRTYNGYSPLELLKIENTFLSACGYQLPLSRNAQKNTCKLTKDQLFLGLSAVVTELCRLDQIPDVMDCSVLFDYQQTKQTKIETDLEVVLNETI
jgi:hypothetical protein